MHAWHGMAWHETHLAVLARWCLGHAIIGSVVAVCRAPCARQKHTHKPRPELLLAPVRLGLGAVARRVHRVIQHTPRQACGHCVPGGPPCSTASMRRAPQPERMGSCIGALHTRRCCCCQHRAEGRAHVAQGHAARGAQVAHGAGGDDAAQGARACCARATWMHRQKECPHVSVLGPQYTRRRRTRCNAGRRLRIQGGVSMQHRDARWAYDAYKRATVTIQAETCLHARCHEARDGGGAVTTPRQRTLASSRTPLNARH